MGLIDKDAHGSSDAMNVAFTGVGGPTGVQCHDGPTSERINDLFGAHLRLILACTLHLGCGNTSALPITTVIPSTNFLIIVTQISRGCFMLVQCPRVSSRNTSAWATLA